VRYGLYFYLRVGHHAGLQPAVRDHSVSRAKQHMSQGSDALARNNWHTQDRLCGELSNLPVDGRHEGQTVPKGRGGVILCTGWTPNARHGGARLGFRSNPTLIFSVRTCKRSYSLALGADSLADLLRQAWACKYPPTLKASFDRQVEDPNLSF